MATALASSAFAQRQRMQVTLLQGIKNWFSTRTRPAPRPEAGPDVAAEGALSPEHGRWDAESVSGLLSAWKNEDEKRADEVVGKR